MRRKTIPILGALGAFGLMMLLFKPEPAASIPTAPGNRRPMPEYQAATLDARPWTLSEHRGKVVLLNFWATWCSPCRMETPGLVRLARELAGRDFEIAGVALDDEVDPVRRFADGYHIPYPVLVPAPGDLLASRMESVPTTFLIDRQGRVAKTYYGAESERVFRQDIERLLAER